MYGATFYRQFYFFGKKKFLTKFQKLASERNFGLEQKKYFFLKITDNLLLFVSIVFKKQ